MGCSPSFCSKDKRYVVEPTQRVVQRRRKRPKVEPKIDEGPRPAEPRPCVRPPEHFTGDEATIMIEEWWFEHGHLCFPIDLVRKVGEVEASVLLFAAETAPHPLDGESPKRHAPWGRSIDDTSEHQHEPLDYGHASVSPLDAHAAAAELCPLLWNSRNNAHSGDGKLSDPLRTDFPYEKPGPVAQAACWGLAAAAAQSAGCRDVVLAAGVLPLVVAVLNAGLAAPGSGDAIPACWLLLQLCRHHPRPSFYLIAPALGSLGRTAQEAGPVAAELAVAALALLLSYPPPPPSWSVEGVGQARQQAMLHAAGGMPLVRSLAGRLDDDEPGVEEDEATLTTPRLRLWTLRVLAEIGGWVETGKQMMNEAMLCRSLCEGLSVAMGVGRPVQEQVLACRGLTNLIGLGQCGGEQGLAALASSGCIRIIAALAEEVAAKMQAAGIKATAGPNDDGSGDGGEGYTTMVADASILYNELCALFRNITATAAGCWQPVALESAVSTAAAERREFLARQLVEGRISRLRYLGAIEALDQAIADRLELMRLRRHHRQAERLLQTVLNAGAMGAISMLLRAGLAVDVVQGSAFSEDTFAAADADGDGIISIDEALAAADTDGDGVISAQEYAAIMAKSRRHASDATTSRFEPEGPVLLSAGPQDDGMTAAIEALYIGLTYMNGEMSIPEDLGAPNEMEGTDVAVEISKHHTEVPTGGMELGDNTDEPLLEFAVEHTAIKEEVAAKDEAQEKDEPLPTWTDLHIDSQWRYTIRPGADTTWPAKGALSTIDGQRWGTIDREPPSDNEVKVVWLDPPQSVSGWIKANTFKTVVKSQADIISESERAEALIEQRWKLLDRIAKRQVKQFLKALGLDYKSGSRAQLIRNYQNHILSESFEQIMGHEEEWEYEANQVDSSVAGWVREPDEDEWESSESEEDEIRDARLEEQARRMGGIMRRLQSMALSTAFEAWKAQWAASATLPQIRLMEQLGVVEMLEVLQLHGSHRIASIGRAILLAYYPPEPDIGEVVTIIT